MNVSRDNLDLQRAMQTVAQASGHDTLQVVMMPGEEEALPGYIAYRGRPITKFRLTSEQWPPRSDTAEGEEIPESCVGVFEPERPGDQTFFPLEDFLRRFDPADYETGPDGTMHLAF